MSRDDDIRIRPGRIRSTKPGRTRSFVSHVLAATQKAGGLHRRRSISSGFGRGRAASLSALRGLTSHSRGVVIKASVVRHRPRAAPLATHLSYLQRDGVTRDGTPGRMFDAAGDEVDARDFAGRCQADRHHFRFIVSPDDAGELSDLRAFTRELMGEMARDLGTRLDWAAIEHWNTEHPHIHVLVRGRGDDGGDLVINRDYISRGLRARAEQLVTLELGPRSEQEIRQLLKRQVDADRWTPLDQALAREAGKQDGIVDLRPDAAQGYDVERSTLITRARKLEKLGLATPLGPGKWMIGEETESVLRALGERGDIIKRIHRGLNERGLDRATAEFVLDAEACGDPIIGRLLFRGLDDELKGSAFAIIDGVDGRAHHVRLKDIDATSDAAPGAIVEVRRLPSRDGRAPNIVIAVRSDFSLEEQVNAMGATWLDRRLVANAPMPMSESGFGREVRDAMEARANHLVAEGLARRLGQRLVFAHDLLNTLRSHELNQVSAQLTAQTGLPRHAADDGETVAGVYRRRLTLLSGRFAMIDDGLGFSLVPWSQSLDKQLGTQLSGTISSFGEVEWNVGRRRGLGI